MHGTNVKTKVQVTQIKLPQFTTISPCVNCDLYRIVANFSKNRFKFQNSKHKPNVN